MSKSCSKWQSETLKTKDKVRELIEQINLYVTLGEVYLQNFTAVEVIRPLYVKIFNVICASLIQFVSISLYSYLQSQYVKLHTLFFTIHIYTYQHTHEPEHICI